MTDWDRNTAWRQGFLLPQAACEKLNLAHRDGASQTLVIIATHDCDLAQSLESEPQIEIIIGRIIDKIDGNFTHAKNSRKLHIEFGGAMPFFAEFEATAKNKIQKESLIDFLPRAETRLTPEHYNIYQYWLASRYRRSAFPDEFEQRLKKAKLAQKISEALKSHGANIAGIFFDVDAGADKTHDGDEDTYILDIYILHPTEPNSSAAEAAAWEAAATIEAAFKKLLFQPNKAWRDIELRSCEAVAESVLTYQQFKQLKRWRLEHISLGSDPQQAVLSE